MLVQGSKGFLKGGKGMVMSGNLQNTTHFGFWMEGYWQGAYDKYIQASIGFGETHMHVYVRKRIFSHVKALRKDENDKTVIRNNKNT